MDILTFISDKKSHRVLYSIGFVINGEGGRLFFEWWFNDGKENVKKQCMVETSDPNLKELLSLLNKEYILDEFVKIGSEYGGTKAFLEFQPNFVKFNAILKQLYYESN